MVDRSELWSGKASQNLTAKKKLERGHNNFGRITALKKGGGVKQKYRLVDFKRSKVGISAAVERLEYDPNRSAFIALIKYTDGELAYSGT